MCPRCNALAWDTVEASGRGVVHSFVLPRHPQWPWFDGTYVVALVELEEGTRLVSNLCGVDPADVWVIGDTPLDVKCARAIGAKAVAVATGWHPADELAACAPDVLLADLSGGIPGFPVPR